MNTYTDSRLINISSDSADIVVNGELLSSCIFYFTGMLKNEEDILYTQISIMNAQIPISYYIINEYNSALRYQIGDGDILTVNFEYGNYNANTFINEFKAKVGNTFNLTLNKINGKYTITNDADFTIFSEGSTVFRVLGFDTSQDYSSSSNTLNAPYPCNFAGITRIKIVSNELSTYAMDSVSGNFSNNLQTISVNSGSYGILLYENTHNFKAILRNKVLDFFDIALLDDNENFIDFNNIPWHMTLQLDIIRKIPETNKSLNIQPPELPVANEQEIEENKAEFVDEPQINIEPLQETTGDSDLDFLLYQNGIYQ